MSKFLHNNYDNAATKATATPRIFLWKQPS